ncbi:MAG: response regulator transcription factor [Pedobacter sp.]|nr:MAG: response regulator transcription factor [Pedobacter sp.]
MLKDKNQGVIRVFLVEDHNIVRNGIKVLLETDPEIEVVGEATNGKEALTYFDNGLTTDIVITDLNMPEIDGISLIKLLKESLPEIKIVVLSMHDNEEYLTAAFSAGADGYLLKNVAAHELIFALKHIYSGYKYVCSELSVKTISSLHPVSNKNAEPAIDVDFSVREMEVLELIAEGLTNAEISEKLFLSRRTVEGHRQTLLEKTGSKNTAMLIRFAFINSLIS